MDPPSSISQYLSRMFSLRGQTAIVTGGTGGLGTALVSALVQAGVSHVVSLELPNDPLAPAFKQTIEGLGAKVSVFPCDVRDGASIRECFTSIWEAGVVPDILLNCAGVMRRNLCENATTEELDLLFDINTKSYYITTQEFGRKLLSLSRPGRVINIASVTSYQAGFNTSIYASSKGAVLQMTKAFSNEWSSRGIQVNCIAPGFMRTTMTDVYANDQKMTDYLMMRVPMQRWGQPDDLAAAVVYLAAPGNTFTSGHCLIVDGGFCGK